MPDLGVRSRFIIQVPAPRNALALASAAAATVGAVLQGPAYYSTPPASPALRFTATTVAFGKKLNSEALAQV